MLSGRIDSIFQGCTLTCAGRDFMVCTLSVQGLIGCAGVTGMAARVLSTCRRVDVIGCRCRVGLGGLAARKCSILTGLLPIVVCCPGAGLIIMVIVCCRGIRIALICLFCCRAILRICCFSGLVLFLLDRFYMPGIRDASMLYLGFGRQCQGIIMMQVICHGLGPVVMLGPSGHGKGAGTEKDPVFKLFEKEMLFDLLFHDLSFRSKLVVFLRLGNSLLFVVCMTKQANKFAPTGNPFQP